MEHYFADIETALTADGRFAPARPNYLFRLEPTTPVDELESEVGFKSIPLIVAA